jgi:hypothetical protein
MDWQLDWLCPDGSGVAGILNLSFLSLHSSGACQHETRRFSPSFGF